MHTVCEEVVTPDILHPTIPPYGIGNGRPRGVRHNYNRNGFTGFAFQVTFIQKVKSFRERL
jgi:hypothetical protein